ncbi:response regulator [Sulfurimonas aquatica]|uniref:Response regulator n=1 Tax=Sulfurimonas aquatica TaxID=2672570 RepID=A0A975AY65_9BACT|nr:response regulator [Sulfurimonas aquatica]QSZ40772.1 response regulator [Sulfurimonas aquatica]
MDINIVKLKKYASECSVLYVEDDELIRSQTASFLGRFFPDVVLAEDGAIGLAKYKERKFDIVITDINMPNMNGIELIVAIREISYEQIVLVTSAYNDSENLMKLINLNVMRFVHKPFNNKQFLYVIYKIAEELSFTRENKELENKVLALSNRAQKILDEVEVAILIIKENKIDMANNSFLEIGGFDSFETLLLEMPEIGVLFEESSHCISVATNQELIEALKTTEKENSKVRIMKETKTIEYQVNLTQLDEEDTYIVTFTDITAIHNALFREEHTQLPTKKFTLEKIEILKQKVSKLSIILISLHHFNRVEKWCGKKDAIEVERAFATAIKEIRDTCMADAFIGYFEKNRIIVIPTSNEHEELYSNLKKINMSTLDVIKKHEESDLNVDLSSDVKQELLDTNEAINNIEVDIFNSFDAM